MSKLAKNLGSTICVVSFVGFLYCAFKHGQICTDLPTYNIATGNTVPYFCKGYGVDPFVTPFQNALRTRLLPALCVTMLIGFGLRRFGSPD